MEKNESLSLTNKEYWYLISNTRKDYFIGAENPYKGWLFEEIQADQQKIKNDLVANGIISSDSQSDSIFSSKYREIFTNIFMAENCLIITSDPTDNKFSRRYVYFQKGKIVEAVHGEDLIYHFRQISGIPSVIKDFNQYYLSCFRPITSSLRIQMKRDEFFDISDLVRNGDIEIAEGQYKTSCNDQDPTNRLFNTIKKIGDNTAITYIQNCYDSEKRQSDGFAYIFGNNDLWLITTRNNNLQNSIVLELASPSSILSRIKELLNK